MTDATTDYIQTAAAARILGVSRESVHRFAATGALPCIKAAGGVRLFSEADVLALKARRDAEPLRRGRRPQE